MPASSATAWFEALGDRFRIHARGSTESGAPGVLEEITPPGAGPPRHWHAHEDEVFRVLDGRVRFERDGATLDAEPGDVVVVPRGTAHTFQPLGDTPSHLFVVLSPGGFEGFFETVAARGLTPERDGHAIAALAAHYGMTLC